MLELLIKIGVAVFLTWCGLMLAGLLGTTGILYAIAFLIVGSAVVICHKLNELKEKDK